MRHPETRRRRLASLAAHLSSGGGRRGDRPQPPLHADGCGSSAAATAVPQPLPLSQAALRAFVVDGLLVLGVIELSAGWHRAVAARATAIAGRPSTGSAARRPSSVAPAGAAADQAALWAELSPELGQVLNGPTLTSALSSLLGPEFLCGGGGHMHEAWGVDQQHHRDGTPRAVREHAPRGLICMYYPNGCTLSMGPTTVCPGSQYLAPDREGFPQSEDRLDIGAPPIAKADRVGLAVDETVILLTLSLHHY